MNYADIKKYDIANGPGVRVSLFVSGCRHFCKGCFNSEAWDFNYGKPFTDDTTEEIIEAVNRDYIKGLSLLGGEPLDERNQPQILRLLREFAKRCPDKSVWCYTGYSFDRDLLTLKIGEPDILREILTYLDVLVDGEFIEDRKDIKLRFRGSDNQRIIDVKESIKKQQTVFMPGTWYIES